MICEEVNARERFWVGIVGVGICSFLAYIDTFRWLYGRFIADDGYYSHGFLVPIISVALVWSQRRELGKIKREYSRIGLVVVLIGIMLHMVGTIVHFYFISGVSIVLVLAGGVLFVFGWGITKKIMFPILFIAFMIPLPQPVISSVLFPMKVFVVKVSCVAIRVMGIPIFVEGFNIQLADGEFVIGNPCSGLRSLISFLAVGSLVGYLYSRRVSEWIAFLVASTFVGFFCNVLRTISLIIIGNYLGVSAAAPESWLHNLVGIAAFIIGCFLLVGGSKVWAWRN